MICSPRHARSERGAVAIVVALTMVALCLAAAFVLDLGAVRVDRQQNKSAADAATRSGIYALVTDGLGTEFHPFRAVCAALDYLQANSPDFGTFSTSTWTDGAGTPATDPCTPTKAAQVCVPDMPTSWARFDGATADGVTVRIQSGYKVNQGEWAEDDLPALAADGGDATFGGCDQLAVMIYQSRQPTLGALAVGSMGSGLRSVGRVTVLPPDLPIALLILERHDCQALTITSAGAGGRIDVYGAGSHPGMIHLDSDGTGDDCVKPIVVGKNEGVCPAPATCGGIVAHASATGVPGIISSYATSNVTDGIPKVYAGPYPGSNPTGRDRVTRQIVDDVFLEHVKDAVDAAKPALDAAASATVPTGFTEFNACTTGGTSPASQVFVNCSNLNKPLALPNATDVIFTGRISSPTLTMPNATRVYVAGDPGTAVNAGLFTMNDGGLPCPAAATPSENRARLFIAEGALKVSGTNSFRACNTSIILMGGDSDACLPPVAPYVVTYTDTPCPGGSTGDGLIDFGGSGVIEWTAPNLSDVAATDDDLKDLEDLALWTESYGAQSVAGSGAALMSGVFMAPNADKFKINGGAAQNLADSQYVVRKLEMVGNGTLLMAPPASLPIQVPELSFSLVR